jgi:hypothetical protein
MSRAARARWMTSGLLATGFTVGFAYALMEDSRSELASGPLGIAVIALLLGSVTWWRLLRHR